MDDYDAEWFWFQIECSFDTDKVYIDEARTVGDVYDYVLWALARGRQQPQCLCPKVFLTLRQTLSGQFGVVCKEITPRTRLAKLLPLLKRRGQWKRLSEALGWKLPPLRDPPGLVTTVALLWASLGMLSIFFLSRYVMPLLGMEWPGFVGGLISVLFVLSAIPFGLVMSRLARPLQRWLPAECRTVSGLVLAIIGLNLNALVKRERYSHPYPWPVLNEPDSAEGARRCTHTVAFLKLRKALADVVGCDLKSIKPDSRLADPIPRMRRRKLWRRMGDRLHMGLPDLERSWLTIAVIAIAIPVAWLLCLLAFPLSLEDRIWLGLLGLFVYGIVIAYRCTIPLAIHFPKDCATFGQLARRMTWAYYAYFSKKHKTQSPAEVWDAPCEILVEHAGWKREEITRDKLLFKDA